MATFDSSGNLIREKLTGPITFGYYQFVLPNGEVLDMFSADRLHFTAEDFKKAEPRRVERTVRCLAPPTPSPATPYDLTAFPPKYHPQAPTTRELEDLALVLGGRQ